MSCTAQVAVSQVVRDKNNLQHWLTDQALDWIVLHTKYQVLMLHNWIHTLLSSDQREHESEERPSALCQLAQPPSTKDN